WWGEPWGPQKVEGISEDRYVASVEYKEVPLSGTVKRAPGSTVGGLFVIHHTNFIIDNGGGTAGEVRYPAHEVGRNGDVFPQESGWPLKVGAQLVWGNTHLHPS